MKNRGKDLLQANFICSIDLKAIQIQIKKKTGDFLEKEKNNMRISIYVNFI